MWRQLPIHQMEYVELALGHRLLWVGNALVQFFLDLWRDFGMVKL
jgi:hypothetical protein